MERIIWSHQSAQPFYVFDEKHVVHFWDDGVSIHHTSKWYKDVDTRLSPFDGPHIYPKALPLEFYKNIVLNERLPISITMGGDNLGTVKRTSGYVYGEAEIGACKRRIIKQEIKLWLDDESLVFSIKVDSTPVDPKTVYGRLRKEDRLPQAYEFEFPFPLDIVPELLNLTESERRIFQRNRNRSKT
ncbi:MAG: hypothetical protein JO121_18585 [Deltaproteobacteria bacterium]|nr:hypothetical protein [Deltaproteobacteria bacterium]